jgi:hypothetical protein
LPDGLDLARQSLERCSDPHRINLEIHCRGIVLADRDRMAQALTNSVGNAFTPPRGHVNTSHFTYTGQKQSQCHR